MFESIWRWALGTTPPSKEDGATVTRQLGNTVSSFKNLGRGKQNRPYYDMQILSTLTLHPTVLR